MEQKELLTNLHYSIDLGNTWFLKTFSKAYEYSYKLIKIEDNVFSSNGRLIKFNCIQEDCNLETIESKVVVYPNPTNDLININSKYDEILIFDLSGKFIEKHLNQDCIEIGHLPNSTYLLGLRSGESIIYKRILKN